MPVAPAYRPVPPRIVPVMRLRAAVPSPFSSLNTWSPRSSVQTLRPCKPRFAVDERDHLRAESDAGTPRPREQHRSPEVDDRAPAIRAEGNGPAGAGSVPGAFELPPLAGGRQGLRRFRHRTAGGRGKRQGNHDGSPPRAPDRRRLRDTFAAVPETARAIVPPRPYEKVHVFSRRCLPSGMGARPDLLQLLHSAKMHRPSAILPS